VQPLWTARFTTFFFPPLSLRAPEKSHSCSHYGPHDSPPSFPSSLVAGTFFFPPLSLRAPEKSHSCSHYGPHDSPPSSSLLSLVAGSGEVPAAGEGPRGGRWRVRVSGGLQKSLDHRKEEVGGGSPYLEVAGGVVGEKSPPPGKVLRVGGGGLGFQGAP
jgi:hypothetical protein